MQSLKKILTNGLMISGLCIGLTISAIAKPIETKANTAVIYGSSFYPSDWIPELTIYARNIETGRTHSVKVAEEVYEYKMTLPAPATYIFFSWTTDKTDPTGAVLSECDGSSVAICDEYNFAKHFPKPIELKSGQVIRNLEVSNYYYPYEKLHLFVPKP